MRLMSTEKRFRQHSDSVFDVLIAIAAVIIMVWIFGRLAYFYNRWHFKKYGAFVYADLPTKYTDMLLDPYDFRQPTAYEELMIRNHKSKSLATGDLRVMHENVEAVRSMLDELVDGPLQVKGE